MGITVLSSANISAPSGALGVLAASSPALPTEGLPTDFAALLAQLGADQATEGELAIPATVDQESTEISPNAADLAAAIQNAIPFLPPAITNTAAVAEPLETGEDSDDLLLGIGQQIATDFLPGEKSGKRDAGPPALALDASAEKPGIPELPPGLGQATAASTAASTPSRPAASSHTELSAANLEFKDGTANIAVETPPQSPGSTSFSAAMTNAAANAAAHRGSAEAATPTVNVPTALHERQWGQDFSEKIVWLAKNDQQTAQISINPPQLGPVQININLNGDQASAVFASPHAEVRQAIEDALPRLREMLSSAGISLGQANVGAQLPQQNREAPNQFANGTRFSNENAILPGDAHSASTSGIQAIQRGRGLVDLFA